MKKPKILVIDDQKEDIEKAREVLGEMFEVKALTNSSQALNVIDNFKPDLVFLDIQMPEENGLEVLKKIKLVYPKLKVIMVTIVKDVNIAVQATKIGAFDYILKPLNPKVLLEKVNKAIEEEIIEEELEKIKQKTRGLKENL